MAHTLNVGGATFAVSKIVCMARNYADHAQELHHSVPPEPIYFLKPPSCLLLGGGEIRLPTDVGRVDVETELAVVLGREGKDVPEDEAMGFVAGYAVFFDITARDLQRSAGAAGEPWTRSKGYDTFGPMSTPVPAALIPDPHELPIRLRINGALRQDARTSQMIFSVPRQIATMSRVMLLEPGDVIATGTPSGVAAIRPGDVLEGEIGGVGRLRCTVVPRKR